MIRAVYILIEGGICIYSRVYDTALADSMLMSSFVSAITTFSREAMGDELRGIESGGHFLFVTDHDKISTVIVADTPGEVSSSVMDYIGVSFLSMFSVHLQHQMSDTSVYRSFDEVIDRIVPQKAIAESRVDPREPLDALSIVEVPRSVRDAALVLLRRQSLQAQQAARELSIDINEAVEKLERLVKLGKAGRKETIEGVVYFI
ncbi:MAG: hypothetical protein C4K49_02895 [Candidatus Thorarchaeota archaeon]|nr:MAG: hypothetical protein C4K49_02895 [Candidatus Thorarchaeota archaeon]